MLEVEPTDTSTPRILVLVRSTRPTGPHTTYTMLNKGYYDASRPDILGRWEVIAEGELDYIGPLYELVKGALRDETQ